MTEQRDTDGVLIQKGGRHYRDPNEALKKWYGGKLILCCTEGVYSNYSTKPCGRNPKHDPDERGFPTKCGHHSAAAKNRKKLASDARQEQWSRDFYRKIAISAAQADIEPALRKIAEGHNDARGLAQEVIAALDKAKEKQ